MRLLKVAVACFGLLAPVLGHAQTWPTGPIRMVVPLGQAREDSNPSVRTRIVHKSQLVIWKEPGSQE